MISERMRRKLEHPNGIRQAFNRALELRQKSEPGPVFDFSIGNPSLAVPESVTEAVLNLTKEGMDHGYMTNAGYEKVRERIAESLNRKYHTAYGREELIMTNGVAGGINCVMCALLNPGDEVLTFAPYYPAYVDFVENWGGIFRTAGTKEDFLPDLKQLQEKINKKTKVVIINSPHNPTGRIYGESVARKIGEILREKEKAVGHEIYLLSDEPYRDLNYGEEILPWWPEIYGNTIVAYSFSKSLSLAGERIGYLLIPEHLTDSSKVRSAVKSAMGTAGYVNAPALFQKVAGLCIDACVDVEYYRKNRDLLWQILSECQFETVCPEGAFYFFVKTPCPEKEFLEKAYQQNLIFVGGDAFGRPGYVRISFCGLYEEIKKAKDAFRLLAEDCHLI